MARVTVEECINKVPNRFDLVLLAAGRTKSLEAGVPSALDREDDKNSVLSLREIESGTIDTNQLRESVIANMQRYATNVQDAVEAQDLKEVEAEIAGESPMYADTEFVASDAFQVVGDHEVEG
ncbi:MAG: DNA-directed RNA polymerase subunit omega [Alphaproteobacteria bacterium]|nr:DNA-directed RNA polymerase subunit omega [Alphaproteobacteria bacterium]